MFDIADNSNQSKELPQNDTSSPIVEGAKIKVIGVGGGGCNAVNTMIKAGLTGIEYVVANTDSQALIANLASSKIQLGGSVTKGLGAGANPEVGRKSAIEDYEKLSESLDGADMIFITAGMGGGTGTGAAPVIAKLARELGALTVGVVTKPFVFEGKKRSRQAEEGIRELEESVDSLICIPNQKLLQLAGENLSLVDTFKAADEVLLNAVQGISDLINNTGLINADFADVATVMTNKGLSLMGSGSATGSDRALKAAKEAISSPLLEDVSINGATGIIINITGDSSLTTHETNQAVTLIMEAADEEAEIIFGTVIDDNMGDVLKVTVIATGLQIPGKNQSIEKNDKSDHSKVNHETYSSYERISQPSPSLKSETVEKVEQTHPVKSGPLIKEDKSYSFYHELKENQDKIQEFTQKPVKESVKEIVKEHVHENAHEQDLIHRFHDDFSKEENESAKKINWAEKLQNAASQYQNSQQTQHSSQNSLHTSQASMQNPSRENRIKSIAEKLGFFNFDEDEFDTPSYMKKNERNPDPQL